jgi:hypothetical protein
MFTTFTLLAAAGVSFRLALAWGLKRRYAIHVGVPEILAGLLLILAGLPDWIKPIPFPFPFSFTLGAVLPDLLIRRG